MAKPLSVGDPSCCLEDSCEMVGVKGRHVSRLGPSNGCNRRLSRSIVDCGGSEAFRLIPRGKRSLRCYWRALARFNELKDKVETSIRNVQSRRPTLKGRCFSDIVCLVDLDTHKVHTVVWGTAFESSSSYDCISLTSNVKGVVLEATWQRTSSMALNQPSPRGSLASL